MNANVQESVLRPLPLPDDASEGFWAAARQGRLAIQRCAKCRRWNHAPSLACPSCGAMDLAYEDVSGKATLFSWTVIREAPAPGFRDRMPLIVGIVELVEQPHLLLVANILGLAEADLRLGLRLRAEFEPVNDECTLPQFRPAKD
ncbi:MAG: OB-fold domain-containing protein [Sphingomonadales bacterium]|nr:OB-fold domain-containing protein [Sphingomonadales bacterium]